MYICISECEQLKVFQLMSHDHTRFSNCKISRAYSLAANCQHSTKLIIYVYTRQRIKEETNIF